jgi:hypothetical protein
MAGTFQSLRSGAPTSYLPMEATGYLVVQAAGVRRAALYYRRCGHCSSRGSPSGALGACAVASIQSIQIQCIQIQPPRVAFKVLHDGCVPVQTALERSYP